MFAYDQYYPSGAYQEFKGFFDTLDAAKARADEDLFESYKYIDIFCIDEKEIIHYDRGGRMIRGPVTYNMTDQGALKK